MNTYASANANLTYQLKNPARTYTIAWYVTFPNRSETGGVEATGGGYSRKVVTFGTPATGSVFNDIEVSFTATAQWSAGLPHVGICVFDDLGTIQKIMTFPAPVIMDEGKTWRFAIGSIEARE